MFNRVRMQQQQQQQSQVYQQNQNQFQANFNHHHSPQPQAQQQQNNFVQQQTNEFIPFRNMSLPITPDSANLLNSPTSPNSNNLANSPTSPSPLGAGLQLQQPNSPNLNSPSPTHALSASLSKTQLIDPATSPTGQSPKLQQQANFLNISQQHPNFFPKQVCSVLFSLLKNN